MRTFKPSSGVYIKDVNRIGEIHSTFEKLDFVGASDIRLCVIEMEVYDYNEGLLITDRDWLTTGDKFSLYNYEIFINSSPLQKATLFSYRITHNIHPQNVPIMNRLLIKHCPIFLHSTKLDFLKDIPVKEESKYGELDMNVDWDNITDWKQIPF